jgi:hypothetical protein
MKRRLYARKFVVASWVPTPAIQRSERPAARDSSVLNGGPPVCEPPFI